MEHTYRSIRSLAPVSNVVDDDGGFKTICANCKHIKLDERQTGENTVHFAKCKASAPTNTNPPRIDLLTGNRYVKPVELSYCTTINHGECINFEEDVLVLSDDYHTVIKSLQKQVDELDPPSVFKSNPWDGVFEMGTDMLDIVADALDKNIKSGFKKTKDFFGRIKLV